MAAPNKGTQITETPQSEYKYLGSVGVAALLKDAAAAAQF